MAGARWTAEQLAAHLQGGEGAVATSAHPATSRTATTRPNRQLEHLEQVAFLTWAEHQAFTHRCEDGRRIRLCLAELIEASLNGAYLQGDHVQRAKQWRRMQAAGAKKNAPDLSLNYPRNGFAGLKIEMKRAREEFSCASAIRNARRPGQAEYLHLLERLGYMTGFAYGWIEAAQLVCVYMDWNPVDRGAA